MAKILVVDDAAFMRSGRRSCSSRLAIRPWKPRTGDWRSRPIFENDRTASSWTSRCPRWTAWKRSPRSAPKDPHARIAMLTAMGQQAIVMDAIKRGARDFVVKPFAPDRVLAAVNKLLAA